MFASGTSVGAVSSAPRTAVLTPSTPTVLAFPASLSVGDSVDARFVRLVDDAPEERARVGLRVARVWLRELSGPNGSYGAPARASSPSPRSPRSWKRAG